MTTGTTERNAPKRVRLTFDCPPELRRALKSEAALRDMHVGDYLTELIIRARNAERDRKGFTQQ